MLNMLNIKDERETVSALHHCGYLSAAKAQVPVYLGSQNHSEFLFIKESRKNVNI